ncbi:hypothetical protein [Nocardiopsis potens]|uniref:hypothetical protein n=1 Tax=Nocardiopsis potens TaxID=1246458 RepID=UPI00034D6FF2|nr:hypothetical protein [Nocardiopsis potens]
MQERTPYTDTDPETIEAVYASYGRMVLGAPPPEGSITIDADDEDDFRRQWAAMIRGEDEEPGAADHPGAPGPQAGAGPAGR